MTTIATDGRSMAGDGQREMSNTITSSEAVKVRRLLDGRIVGTAGSTALGNSFIEWLSKQRERPDIQADAAFNAIVLNLDGSVEMYDGHCVPMAVALPAAIGSGMDLALGAMEAGASPEKAVHIAAKRDAGTGGRILVVRLEPPLKAVA